MGHYSCRSTLAGRGAGGAIYMADTDTSTGWRCYNDILYTVLELEQGYKSSIPLSSSFNLALHLLSLTTCLQYFFNEISPISQ